MPTEKSGLAKRINTQLLNTAARLAHRPVNDIPAAISICGSDLALRISDYWGRTHSTRGEGLVDVVDMFSGCGGMSAGFLTSNVFFPTYRHILAIDIDDIANRTYEANIGLRPTKEDIAGLVRSPGRLKRLVEQSDRDPKRPLVLIGCAPCQGFSSHRNSAGSRDIRNSLFLNFATLAAALQPDAVVIENVPELLTTKYWPFVRDAQRTLKRAGYHLHLGVYNMAAFGVAQERFRAVMIGLRHPVMPLEGFLARRGFRTVRQVIGHLPRVRAGERRISDPLHYSAAHSESTLATIRAVPKNGGNRPEGIGPKCLIAAKERQGRSAYDDVYGRLHWDRPAITITAYSRNPASGRFIHPQQDRGLTVREAALLQGFPESYEFCGTLDECFRQIGNAVPPAFAAHLSVHLLAQLAIPVAEKHELGIQEPMGSSFSRLIPTLKAS